MVHSEAKAGHGHASQSLSAAVGQAIRNALHGEMHKKVLIFVTAVASHKHGDNTEYDVEATCICIDEENESDTPAEEAKKDYESHHSKEQHELEHKFLEDFYAAELPAHKKEELENMTNEERQQHYMEFIHHILEHVEHHADMPTEKPS